MSALPLPDRPPDSNADVALGALDAAGVPPPALAAGDVRVHLHPTLPGADDPAAAAAAPAVGGGVPPPPPPLIKRERAHDVGGGGAEVAAAGTDPEQAALDAGEEAAAAAMEACVVVVVVPRARLRGAPPVPPSPRRPSSPRFPPPRARSAAAAEAAEACLGHVLDDVGVVVDVDVRPEDLVGGDDPGPGAARAAGHPAGEDAAHAPDDEVALAAAAAAAAAQAADGMAVVVDQAVSRRAAPSPSPRDRFWITF